MRVIPLVLTLRCKGGGALLPWHEGFQDTRIPRRPGWHRRGGRDSFGTVISGAAIMIAVAVVFSMMRLSCRFGGKRAITGMAATCRSEQLHTCGRS